MPTQLDLTIVVFGVLLTGFTVIRLAQTNLHRLPASALGLLFLLYGLFGWVLAIYNVPWWAWLGGVVASVAIATVPSIYLGRTGLAAFGLAVIAAIVAVFNVAQVARSIALGLAIAGAWVWMIGGTRYRMEKVRVPRSTILWTIILISWEGIWLGWVIDTFLTAQFGRWLSQMLMF